MCSSDLLTADVAWNRLPRAVAEALLARPDVDREVKESLRAAADEFDGVTVAPLTPELCAAADPLGRDCPIGYGPLLDFSGLLAAHLMLRDRVAPTFLLDLEVIWERYVTGTLVCALGARPDCVVHLQPFRAIAPHAPGQPDVHVRPDAVVERAGRPQAVFDAKWKRLSGTAVATGDVYQVLTYASVLGAPRVVLVYPGDRWRRWVYSTAGPRLEVCTLRVTGSGAGLERSRRRLWQIAREA